MVGKVIETKFLVYLNHELYKVGKTFEDLDKIEEEIMASYRGFKCVYGCHNTFSVYMNENTKEVFTWWYKITEKTNIKDKNGKVVYVGDTLKRNGTNRKCWLHSMGGELYVRFDGWFTIQELPDIRNVSDLSDFEVIKEIEKI